MDISKISAGKNPPEDINVFVEIPQGSSVKYELDKESGAIVVDRFTFTSMHYPCNYGFVPGTLADDGDPVDVLVLSREPVVPGSVVRCRPIGALSMKDEAGNDTKIIAVPHSKVDATYDNIKTMDDIPKVILEKIKHFFEHYKELEPGKWVNVEQFQDTQFAFKEITKGIADYK
jgi:inorganic pyrophosphatase